MRIDALTLDFFRNYVHLDAAFDPDVNVIYGDNAQGKTNLLEGIAYLSGVSHRARYDKELIQFGVERAFLRGSVFSRGRDFTLEAELSRSARRVLRSNGVKLKSAAELCGVFQSVLFCPEDLYLIREGAAVRRKFLDDCLCQLRPRYAQALAEYKRLHEQKTRILRDSAEKPSLLDTLDEFSLGMAKAGATLIRYRAYFVEGLRREAAPIHAEFSGGNETLSMRYETVSTVTDPKGDTADIFKELLAHQETLREAEIASRQCLSGAHKDDLVVEIDGESARTFASQGQTRTAALSLKLAARELFEQDTGEYPVLLLDDVLSELDPKRQEFVLSRIRGGQVFITCCEDDRLQNLPAGRVLHIQNGATAG
ncbi:MAG: DNA replication/repair protein RecF [Oscillibacter sp.]|nr:DNA replication/repair protein RecF [Oscillibacter sp.]